MKRYHLPKYLIKRKIELLRQRIITRKFGYLFYRKTVSKILPSEAHRYHKGNLMRTHFEIWYHLSVGWKLSLRAHIHYNLKLTHLYLKKWKEFYAWSKSEAIKRRTAVVHYENNWKCLEGRLCFQKWKIFTACRKYNKTRLRFAWNHFKTRHPEALRPYFYRWMAFAKVSRKSRQKQLVVRRFYEHRLLGKCLKVLLNYRLVRKHKTQLVAVAINFHQKKLLLLSFSCWKLHHSQQVKKKLNLLLAQTCYSFKVQKVCLHKLMRHAARQKFLRQLCRALERLLLKKCLQRWIKFTQIMQVEKTQIQLATALSNSKLKRAALGKLAQYVHYKKRKFLINLQILEHAREHLKKCKLNFYFCKWKSLVYDTKIQTAKLDLAAKYSTLKVKKLALNDWMSYIHYKKYKKALLYRAVEHYNIYLRKLGVKHFKGHLAARRTFKIRIEEAKQFYKTSMIEEAIRVVMLTGIRKKQNSFQDIVAKISRELFVAQKYLEIWKSKTIFKAVIRKMEDVDDGFCDIGQDFCPNPGWFQMCFMLPRVYNSDII